MKKPCRFGCLFALFTSLMLSVDMAFAQQAMDDFVPVLLTDLEQVTGLGGVVDVTNNTNLEAVLTDNTATDSVTGNNTIDAGSFSEASGVFSIIQNTGNNVIIQDSTIITVTITPN